MFADEIDAAARADTVVGYLSSAELNKAHNKHLGIDKVREIGVVLEQLEEHAAFQDAVLTVHHCFMHTMTNTTAIKVVENHEGRAAVRHVAQQAGQPQPQIISIGLGGPT